MDEFVGYVGDPAIHDSTIVSATFQDGRLIVVTKDPDDFRIELAFTGVRELDQHEASGMVVYALTEKRTPAGERRYVFANWHEPNESDSRLSLLAIDMQARRLT